MILDNIKYEIQNNNFKTSHTYKLKVICRILTAFGWDIYDDTSVIMDYNIVNKCKFDYALKTQFQKKPIIFIKNETFEKQEDLSLIYKELKNNKINNAVIIIFNSFNISIHFMETNQIESTIYKCNFLENSSEEIWNNLEHYLSYEKALNNEILKFASDEDFKQNKEQRIDKYIPIAWNILLTKEYNKFIDIISQKVKELCNFTPLPENIIKFLESYNNTNTTQLDSFSETKDNNQNTIKTQLNNSLFKTTSNTIINQTNIDNINKVLNYGRYNWDKALRFAQNNNYPLTNCEIGILNYYFKYKTVSEKQANVMLNFLSTITFCGFDPNNDNCKYTSIEEQIISKNTTTISNNTITEYNNDTNITATGILNQTLTIYREPSYIILDNIMISVKSWNDILLELIKYLLNHNKYNELIDNPTFSNFISLKDNINQQIYEKISTNSRNIFIKTHGNITDIVSRINKILEYFQLESKFKCNYHLNNKRTSL